MSEMVERVAKAIWNDDELWATLPRAVKDDKMKRARTVIEAMNPPTEAMIGEGRRHVKAAAICSPAADVSTLADVAWSAMLTAALA